ncbi:MAG: hypothetical protein AAGA56_04235 [Myxococcota bacterium]
MLAPGLTHLDDKQLQRLLTAVHRGRVDCPLRPDQLMMAGLSDVYDRVAFLRGLDRAAVQAVLVAVIAERRTNNPPGEEPSR